MAMGDTDKKALVIIIMIISIILLYKLNPTFDLGTRMYTYDADRRLLTETYLNTALNSRQRGPCLDAKYAAVKKKPRKNVSFKLEAEEIIYY
jgi:hypothetical protein